MHTTKWYSNTGEVIACVEKIKVMQQNLTELINLSQDIIDDGVLMNISEQQIKQVMQDLIAQLTSSFKEQ